MVNGNHKLLSGARSAHLPLVYIYTGQTMGRWALRAPIATCDFHLPSSGSSFLLRPFSFLIDDGTDGDDDEGATRPTIHHPSPIIQHPSPIIHLPSSETGDGNHHPLFCGVQCVIHGATLSSGHARSDDARSDDARPGDARSDDARSYDARSDDGPMVR